MTKDPRFGEFAYGGVSNADGERGQRHSARRPARPLPRRPRRPAAAPGAGSRRVREGAADRRERRAGSDPVRCREPHRRAHQTGLSIGGLPAGTYAVTVNDRQIATHVGGSAEDDGEVAGIGIICASDDRIGSSSRRYRASTRMIDSEFAGKVCVTAVAAYFERRCSRYDLGRLLEACSRRADWSTSTPSPIARGPSFGTPFKCSVIVCGSLAAVHDLHDDVASAVVAAAMASTRSIRGSVRSCTSAPSR